MIKAIEERHEKSRIKKFPDQDGQESLFHVCGSALIVNALFQLYWIDTNTYIRLKNTQNSLYRRKSTKILTEYSRKFFGSRVKAASGLRYDCYTLPAKGRLIID